MFSMLIQWLRSFLKFENAAQAGKDHGLVISTEMETAIDLWARMYTGGGDWCDCDKVHSLRIAGAVAAELSRLVTLEMEVEISGSPRAAFLQEQLLPFESKLRNHMELACALGGMVFKPFVSSGRILVDAVRADCFFPINFDSSKHMTGAVFCARLVRGGKIYTRLEQHTFNGNAEKISNKAYVSSTSSALGNEIPLTDVDEWSEITPQATITGIDRPLFAYFRVPIANKVDMDSPLGVSVFSEAVETIKDADLQYGRILWEYEGGELAVDVDETALRHNSDGTISVPKRDQRLFRGRVAPSGVSTGPFYNVFAPALRDESYRQGLDSILKKVEFQCGLAYGTLSDPNQYERTAEEVRASKQRSFSTVRDIQKALENTLNDLVYAMDKLATLYQLAPQGSYQIAYSWDDSIVNDPVQRKQQFWQYVTSGKFPMWRYLVDFEGYTEADARALAGETAESLENPFGFRRADVNT